MSEKSETLHGKFFIYRTDASCGYPTKPHDTLADAMAEAERLGIHHVKENPTFEVLKLKTVKELKVSIQKHVKDGKKWKKL